MWGHEFTSTHKPSTKFSGRSQPAKMHLRWLWLAIFKKQLLPEKMWKVKPCLVTPITYYILSIYFTSGNRRDFRKKHLLSANNCWIKQYNPGIWLACSLSMSQAPHSIGQKHLFRSQAPHSVGTRLETSTPTAFLRSFVLSWSGAPRQGDTQWRMLRVSKACSVYWTPTNGTM